ncbi:MAG: hypothetical protein KC419_07145, partial [Anaerolineales bacterium]|nr:hypothetical protein [Anaerolineales bacterium]
INIASRLEKFSQGTDIVMSDAVSMDPEVQDFLEETAATVKIDRIESELKGFDDECFTMWRIEFQDEQ